MIDKKLLKQIKIVAFDLDHTLLHDANKITQYAIDTCQKLLSKGYYVVVCTGRPSMNTNWIVDKIGENSKNFFQICVNGGYVKDIGKGEIIFQKFLNEKKLPDFYKYVKETKFRINAYTGDKIFASKKTFVTKWLELTTKSAIATSRIENFPTKHVLKLVVYLTRVIFTTKLLETLEAKWGNYFEFIKSNWGGYEIGAKDVTKSFGLEYIAKYLNLKMTNVMAIGDGSNDHCMIVNSGIGVAMKNAGKQLIRKADYVTDYTFLRDGAARFVAKNLLGEKDR